MHRASQEVLIIMYSIDVSLNRKDGRRVRVGGMPPLSQMQWNAFYCLQNDVYHDCLDEKCITDGLV